MEQLARWAAALAVALLLVLLMEILRRERHRAATAVEAAQDAIRDLSALQDLAAACSAALTQDDVARAPSRGFSAAGRARRRARPRRRSRPRSRRPGHGGGADASRGHAHPADRASADRAGGVERRGGRSPQPRGVRALVPGRHQAHVLRASGVAVPLRVAGEAVGAISFLYDDEDAMLEDAEALAGIAADLGGQALSARASTSGSSSRARRWIASRDVSDLPRGQLDAVTHAVCREARMAFGADIGMVWRLQGHTLELLRSDPVLEPLEPGLVASLEDFLDLLDAVGDLRVLRRGCPGGGRRERTRARAPSGIALEPAPARRRRGKGRAPDHRVLGDGRHGARSLDDPARPASRRPGRPRLSAAERRRAEAEVIAYADETRRLQEVTEALSVAVSATDVGDACLAHAVSAVGADAGFVVVSRVRAVSPTSSRAPATRRRSFMRSGYDLDADARGTHVRER